jgi:IPT/TIG domain-containing protein
MRRAYALLFMAAMAVGCSDSTAPALSVGAIAPHSGQTVGGIAATIYGTGFVTGATATFGGTAATSVRVIGPSSITATSPAHAAGTVDLVVTNPDGQTATIASGFIYADFAGSWSGTTSQGKPISFMVGSSNAMTQLSWGFVLQGNGCTSSAIAIDALGTLGIDISSSGVSFSSATESIRGTFGSSSSASGTFTISAATGCVGSVTATWNATKH